MSISSVLPLPGPPYAYIPNGGLFLGVLRASIDFKK